MVAVSARSYTFAGVVLAPRRRTLTRGGADVPLIPRYFDLLVFLVERRHEAVSRRDIFDHVWTDVIVSDSALSQAIRTIRRALGDDPREPRVIRTVSRHGYQFVAPDLAVVDDDVPAPVGTVAGVREAQGEPAQAGVDAPAPEVRDDAFEPLIHGLLRLPTSADEALEQRDVAERLHQLGTAEALRRIGTRAHHEHARAVLRDTRWAVPGAAEVPLLGEQGGVRAGVELAGWRVRDAARLAVTRGTAAAGTCAVAGIAGGLTGGGLLAATGTSSSPVGIAVVFALVGALTGAMAGGWVGAGTVLGEAVARSRRTAGMVGGGLLGGALAGLFANQLATLSLELLFGLHVTLAGWLDGAAIGFAAALGFASAARRHGGVGLAAPRGRARALAAAATGGTCLVATVALALAGRALVGGSLHQVAQAAPDSQVALSALGRLMGEPDFGRVTQTGLAAVEGLLFGVGLATGLTRRPRG